MLSLGAIVFISVSSSVFAALLKFSNNESDEFPPPPRKSSI